MSAIQKSCMLRHALSILGDYRTTRTYDGTDWGGVERLNMHIAALTKSAAIESAGWYSYPTSRRQYDGKDWRIVLPEHLYGLNIVVNCHSLLHDGYWTLATSTFETYEVDNDYLKLSSDNDPMRRVYIWTLDTMNKLETKGMDYTTARENLLYRLYLADSARPLMNRVKSHIDRIYERVFHKSDNLPRQIGLYVGDWMVKKGKVAVFRYDDKQIPFGVLMIHPKAFERGANYVYYVIAHELCHSAMEDDHNGNSHGEMFQELASNLGIPKNFQD